jgi:O-antigen/teichoic acid export membrane protein
MFKRSITILSAKNWLGCVSYSINITKPFRKFLERSGFIKNVATLTGGTVVAQMINLLSSPIIARIYTPEDLGNLSVYISIASIVGGIACLRYERAIPIPKDDNTAISLLALSLVITLWMAGVLWVILFLFNDQIILWINAPGLKPCLWLLPFSFMGMGIYQALSFWAIRMNAYDRIAQTKFSQSLGMVVIQIGLGLVNLKPAGLLIGDVVGRSCGISTLAISTWKVGKDAIRVVSAQRIMKAANQFRRFPLISTAAGLVNSVNLWFPPLITSSIYGAKVAGQLMLAQIVLGMPTVLLANSISQAYFGESAKVLKNTQKEQMPLFRKILFRLVVIGTPVYLLIAIITPWTFYYIFGDKWMDAALYVQIMTPMFVFQFIGSPLSAIQDILQRQDLQMVAEITRMALLFGAAFASSSGNLEPFYWILFMSVSTAVAYIISIYVSYITIRKHTNINDLTRI